MTKYAPGYYYRIIARNKTIDLVITQLVNMVKEFRDSDEMRLAALTAFRSLIDLISYREIYQTMEISDWQSLVIQLILNDLKVQNDIHCSLAAILITYQLLDIIPPNEKNNLSDLESTFPIDVAQSHLYGTNPRDHPEWNPANEKNKTEKFFMEVFQSYRSGNGDAEKDLDFYLTSEKDRKKFSPGASKVLSENFEQLMKGILNQRKHRNNNYLNPYLLRIIPKLAAFNPEQFEKIALSDTVDYCIDQINKNENRNAALTSLGLVVYLVSKSGSLIFSEKPLLQKIITCYRHVIEEEGGLSEDPASAGRRFNPVNPNLFKSLNLIILGIGCNPNVNLHSLKEPNSLWKSNENRYFLNLVMAAGYVKERVKR